jgi:hypothetical protein
LWVARNFRPLAVTANVGYRFYAHHLGEFYTCDWPLAAMPGAVAQSPTTSSMRAVCG